MRNKNSKLCKELSINHDSGFLLLREKFVYLQGKIKQNNIEMLTTQHPTNHHYTPQEINDLMAGLIIQSKETDRKLSKIGKLVGNMGRNTGAYAEEYFYHRLKNHNQLLNIKFTLIDRDVKREDGKLDGQYDLILHNGQYLFVVEIKYKLHPNDIIKFKEKALPKFKKLFPEYSDKKLYIVLAGMVVIPDCKQLCEDYGFLLLTQAGKDITILNEPEFKPQTY